MTQNPHSWDLGSLDLDGLQRMAELLSLYLAHGDLVLLEGDLGAGKTTFARFLIRALTGNPSEDVPSPTFALVQSYETPRATLHHFDLYRLAGPNEIREIGLDEALTSGLALVEWPDRAQGLLPANCLRIVLEDSTDPEQRAVTASGMGAFAERLSHIETVWRFISANGWGQARISPILVDASRRSYARLTERGSTCLLMDSPPLAAGPSVRDGKPYWAIAHSAATVQPFIDIASELDRCGLSVPGILAQSAAEGLLLVEDFGDRTFSMEISAGRPMHDLYLAATDVLVELAGHQAPASVPDYDSRALTIETSLLIDWYWRHATGTDAPKSVQAEFDDLWRDQVAPLTAAPRNWVLRDFHSPNLLWLPERQGIKKVGVIDFQDALAGPAAYDLVSLLQDARLDVPETLERDLLEHYMVRRSAHGAGFDRATFLHTYALMGAQRATKLLGIFVRLAKRDNKPGYLRFLPRIKRYLARNLAHPGLVDLRAWYEHNLPP